MLRAHVIDSQWVNIISLVIYFLHNSLIINTLRIFQSCNLLIINHLHIFFNSVVNSCFVKNRSFENRLPNRHVLKSPVLGCYA